MSYNFPVSSSQNRTWAKFRMFGNHNFNTQKNMVSYNFGNSETLVKT